MLSVGKVVEFSRLLQSLAKNSYFGPKRLKIISMTTTLERGGEGKALEVRPGLCFAASLAVQEKRKTPHGGLIDA